MHRIVQNCHKVVLSSFLLSLITFSSFANAPIITSLSVTSGPVGSTVTIKGTDFPGTVAWTEVYFGNARVTNYTYASTTSLTVTVPVGATYGPVIVCDRINVRYGTSNVFFNPTYSPNKGSILAGDMNASAPFTTGTNPLAVAVGDVDGDAKPDVVVVNNTANTVSVFRNTSTIGNFSFDAKVDYATGVKPSAVLLADMDNDRKMDIVVLNNGSTNVSVFKNNCTSGTISFAARVNGATGTTGYNTNAIAVGDIDHDGYLDIIATNGLKNTISILLNTSTSTAISFATKVEYPTGTSPHGVAIGDIDGDTNIDIVVANNSGNSVSVIKNLTSMTGTTAMAAKVDYSVGTGPQAVALGDIDNDGKLDIITSNFTSGSVSILRNTSFSNTISLSTAVNKTTAASAQSIGLADIDGDGKVDITNANSAGIISVLKNSKKKTTPSFVTAVGFSTGTANVFHTMGDVDGDGKIDAVVLDNTSNSFVVLRNGPTYSNNANLSAITTTAGTISPVFSASTYSYTASVPNTNTGITITATKQQDSAKIQIQMNGGAFVNINSGSPSMLYTLASGENTYNIKVTAQDGTTVQTYTLVVTKAAVPIISAITPSSAPVGTTATITGKFFNSIAANNIVFFGGVQAAVTAATATSLSVTVPTGATYGPVTVLNTDALLTSTSKVFFNPTFKPNKGSIDTMDMTVSANFGVNGYPSNLAVGDIDGDGKSDAVVLDKVNSKLSVLRNTSSSGSVNFAPKVDFTTLSSTETVKLGDINNDGKLDVVVVNFLTDSVSIYRNTSTIGAISFAAKVNILCGLSIGTYRKCVIGDIDGDGKPDITLGTYSLGEYVISVLRNTSTSATNLSFAFFTTFVTGNNPIDLAIGDIDKDGKADIVTANKNPANATGTAYYQISILKNTSTIGTISFATKQDFMVDGQPSAIALADIDGDGVNDIVTCNVGTNNISVLINYSNTSGLYMGTFRNFTIGANTGYMNIADIDGDGRLDIAVTPNGKGLYILRNVTNTTGASNVTFAPVVTLAKAINLSSIATGDIDGDGKVDIAAINTTAATDSLVVLRNTPILSRNNNLVALSVTAGALNPVFDSLKTTYSINVHNYVTNTTVTATKQQDSAKIELQFNGSAYTSFANGSTSTSLPLNIGVNTINMRVTAQNGDVKVYSITITRACLASPSTTKLSICSSELPFKWNTMVFTKAGTQGIILTNAAGCDSTATLILSLKANSTSTTDLVACDSVIWNGTTYKSTGSYTYHTQNSIGCDSAATLNLTIRKSTSSWTDLVSCDSVLWNGVWYNKSGFYTFHTFNKAGCDSTASLNLTINEKPIGAFASFAGEICEGDTSVISFVIPTTKNLQYLHIYSPIDTTFEMGTAGFGYNPQNDRINGSLVYLPNLSPDNQACSTAFATHLFEGKIVVIDRGTCSFVSKAKAVQDAGAVGMIIVNNVAGGGAVDMAGTDPTVVIPVISVSQEDGLLIKNWINASKAVIGYSVVHKPTYLWSTGETTQTISFKPTKTGIHSVTVSYENGCSQIYYYSIIVRKKSSSWTDLVSCDSAIWHGVTYRKSGEYFYHTMNAIGCDSTATLALTIKSNSKDTIRVISETPFTWHDSTYTKSGVYTFHSFNSAGCDSLTVLILNSTLPISFTDFSALGSINNILLKWHTSTELNTNHFIVQHSADGTSFTDFGLIKAIGTGANGYQFTDKNPIKGINYYRLKTVDKDGTAMYSRVVSCEWLVVSKQLAVYPNPSKNFVTVKGSHIASVQVVDNLGRVIKVITLKDASNPTLSVRGLPAGVYHLQVNTTDGNVSGVVMVKE